MTKIEKKRYLFIFEHAPHSTLHAKEGLDFSLACAAFDQKVSVLFMGNGVYQLLRHQDSSAINLKNHSASIEALELYGIEHCYYQGGILEDYELSANLLAERAQAKSLQEIQKLIQQHDHVFTY